MLLTKRARLALPMLAVIGLGACADGQAGTAAEELYEQGVELEQSRRGVEDLRAAEAFFQQAVAADSTFALGHAGLARTNAGMIHFMYEPTPERRARAREEAETALRLQPESGEAHHAMGVYWYWAEKDYARAATEFDLAGKALPDNAEVQAMAGYVQRRRGEWAQALSHLERAAELDPTSSGIRVDLADTYEAFGRIDESLATWKDVERLQPDGHFDVNRASVVLRSEGMTDSLRAALDRVPADFDPDGLISIAKFEAAWIERRPDPAFRALGESKQSVLQGQNFYSPILLLAGRAYRLAGNEGRARSSFDSARVALEAAIVTQPDDARLHVALGSALAGLGRSADAIREADRATALMPREKDALINQAIQRQVAQVYADAGQSDRAVAILESVFAEPVFAYSRRYLQMDPLWTKLRGHPGFQALIAAPK
jgi:tetratricopeptide (TPR) repeat protein